jgi:parallel beta-helix repeat protein
MRAFATALALATLMLTLGFQTSHAEAPAGIDLQHESTSRDEIGDAYGPAQGVACPPEAIRMAPGNTLQDIVNSAPPGATFCLSAGVYVNQTIHPRSGDVYIGEPGAVMDGSKSARYAFMGIHAPNSPDNPRNVTIRGLTIQNYASANSIKGRISPDAAIEGGEGWLIEGNVVRDNISGLSLGRANWTWGDGAVVRGNQFLNNAEIGVEINGSNLLFEGNVLAGNGWSLTDSDRTWSGGGSKFTDQPVFADNQFAGTTSRGRSPEAPLVIRGNHVHHNAGSGLWLDIHNQFAVVEGNTVEDNYGSGIVDELSNGTRIRGNVVRRNRAGNPNLGAWGGAEILLINSQGGEVTGNDVTVTGQGRALIMIYEAGRGNYPSQNYRVTGNVFRFETQPQFSAGGDIAGGVIGGTGDAPFYDVGNRFEGNQYHLTASGLTHWYWGRPMTWAEFQAAGQEAGSVCFVAGQQAPC